MNFILPTSYPGISNQQDAHVYIQGTTAYNKADYTTAATAFVNAYKCDSTKAEAAYYAAKSYVALNQTEDAKKYYQYIVDGFRSSSYYSEANAYVTSHS